MGEVETGDIETSSGEGLAIQPRPSAEIDDGTTSFGAEKGHERIAQLKPPTRCGLTQLQSRLLLVVRTQTLLSRVDVHRQRQ